MTRALFPLHFLPFLLLVFFGCSGGGLLEKKKTATDLLATEVSNESLEKWRDDAPARNKLLTAIETGRVQQLKGDFEASRKSFDLAIDILEKREDESLITANKAVKATGSALVNDRVLDYRGDSHEWAMIFHYQALNHLALGDREKMLVSARQLGNVEDRIAERYKRDIEKEQDNLEAMRLKLGITVSDPIAAYREQVYSKLDLKKLAHSSSGSNRLHNAYCHYFCGLLFESAQQNDTALIHFRQALELNPHHPVIRADALRMAQKLRSQSDLQEFAKFYDLKVPTKNPSKSPQVKANTKPKKTTPEKQATTGGTMQPDGETKSQVKTTQKKKNGRSESSSKTKPKGAIPAEEKPLPTGRLVVFFETGRIAEKQEFKLSFPTASGIASLAIPTLNNPGENPPLLPPLELSCASVTMNTQPLTNFNQLAFESYRHSLPLLGMRQVIRLISKQILADEASGRGGVYGMIGSSIYNVVSERADLRGWSTLPEQVQIGQLELRPGTHQLNLWHQDWCQQVELKIEPNSATLLWVNEMAGQFTFRSFSL